MEYNDIQDFKGLDNKYPFIIELLKAPSDNPQVAHESIPDDIYNATIERLYLGYTNKGAKAIKTVFSITDNEFKDRKVYLTYIIPDNYSPNYQINQLANYINLLNPLSPSINSFIDSNLNQYIGKNCIIELKTGKNNFQVPKIKKVY